MGKYLFIVIVFSAAAFAQRTKDVRILSEDSQSLTLEFTPAYSSRTVKAVDGKDLKRITFQSEILDNVAPGSAWISYRGIPLQFPTSRVSVTVLTEEFRTMNGIRPIPIPAMVPDKKLGLSPSYQSVVIGKVPVRQLVQVTDIGPSQGKFVGVLKIYPVEYNEDAGNAKLFTRVVVTIRFDPWSNPSIKSSQPMAGFPGRRIVGAVPAGKQKTASDSPLAQGTWYKMEVRQTGIYRIDQNFLKQANISLSSIGGINSIRIFGNGGKMLSENVSQPRPDGLVEIARDVIDSNGDGVFDADDYVLFYGRSTRGWDYNPGTKSYSHYLNNYSEPNFYFLTFGGTQGIAMDSIVSTNIAGVFSPADFQEKILLKQELHNLLGEAGFGAGRQWVGQKFDYFDNVTVYSNSLPGYIPSQPVQYRFVFFTHSSSIDTFTVSESGGHIGNPILMYTVDTDPGNNVTDYAYISPQITMSSNGLISGNRSLTKIEFGTNNTAAVGWIDYMDLFYRRSFNAVGNVLLFDSPDTTAVVEYVIRDLPTDNVFAYDVTDQNSVKRITQVRTDVADGTVRRFQIAQNSGSIRKIAVVGLPGMLTPAHIISAPNSNLHGLTAGADFVIVSPGAFAEQAERLRTYRESHDSLKSIVVNIDNIYNEFSGGLLDPMAIRDFLKYAVTNWSVRPRYVLLFGGGHYDYKNITTAVPSWLPPYESIESNTAISSFASDDFFVMLDAGNLRVSIPLGRIPARSVDDATAMVDKIIEYETNSPFDTWRNRITYVGDDGLTSQGDDGYIHTAQAEDLAVNHTPDSFEKRKIYLSMYPTVLSASGRTKPQVNKDIVAAFNRGSLIVNFSGHGNTLQWTHEAVFTQAADIPQLVNFDRLTFLVAATCNFGQYDDPNDLSAGAQVLLMPKGGAVSEVTSSRAVFQGLNEDFNNLLYDNLFPRDSQGNPPRLGDDMWLTKQVLFGTNDIKYHLLGDPTMRLNVPRSSVSLDSVNGISTSQVVSMKSLGIESVAGLVKKPDGTPWPGFNGTGVIEVFDSQQQILLQDIGYSVEVMGSILYRGEVSIKNGTYHAVFPIPKDVTYGNRARLSLYGWNNATDGVGYTENVTINGTDSTAAVDTSGPRVTIYFDDQSFRPGDRIKPNSTLIVDLQSRNGINTSTVGIGHRLEAILNTTTNIDLTDYYRGDLDTYQSGEIRYPMSNLADGKYTLLMKAWDIRNNSTQSETYFVVSSTNDLEMANVVNYPNPFSRSTSFTFQRNSQDPIDVEVRIYTIAGRLIQIINSNSITDRFVQISWDGRDRDGDPLANGVYLYKIIAKTVDRRITKEEMGKLVIMK